METEIEEPGAFAPKQTWISGEMAIALLYVEEDLSDAFTVLCGPKLHAEIQRLRGMKLADRMAEREAAKGAML